MNNKIHILNQNSANLKRKSDLSPPVQKLIDLFRKINYGRIENFKLKGGEPVFDKSTKAFKTYKFGAKNGRSICILDGDYRLKHSIHEMIDSFKSINNGRITKIEILNGLPNLLSMEVELNL